jgi:hypothetical protein
LWVKPTIEIVDFYFCDNGLGHFQRICIKLHVSQSKSHMTFLLVKNGREGWSSSRGRVPVSKHEALSSNPSTVKNNKKEWKKTRRTYPKVSLSLWL